VFTGGGGGGGLGGGADHWCRDWDAIWKWAEENRTGDSKGVK
jgi:hypothetical protein